MHFLIVRRLTQSELGWFGEFRRLGRETSKQRGINFDAEVVERVFPTAQSGSDINLSLRFRGDDGIRAEIHPLKRQHKNWRLVGEKIEDRRFGTVDPGDLFLLTIDAIGETPDSAFTVVKAESDLARFVMGCSQTSGLGRNGMIAVHSSESGNLEQHLAAHDQDLFGVPAMAETASQVVEFNDDGPLTNEDLHQPPEAGRTLEAFANIGHDLNIAVADLIDNSIEAGAHHVEVTFPNPNDHGRILAIIDDAPGMKPRELARKLGIGARRRYQGTDLGKYGLGLKAASLSQARAVYVASRTKDTGVTILGWDKARVSESGWNLIRPELDERRDSLLRDPLADGPGTVVLWDDMIPPRNQRQNRNKAKGEAISAHGLECLQLVRHLGKVFHRFIEGKARGKPRLHLTVNGNEVQPLDPMVGWHPDTQRLATQSIRIPSGADKPDEIVEIHPVIIPGSTEFDNEEDRDKVGFWGNWQKSQGFYFYRNDRIIQDGGWCGLWIDDPHYQLLRVAVDLNGNLDQSFGINVAKMTAQPPAYFTTEVTSLLGSARSEAKRRYSPAGRKEKRTKRKPPPTSSPGQPPQGNPAGGPSPRPLVSPQPNPATPPEAEHIKLVPLGGKGWRCRTNAIGKVITELDADVPQARTLHAATAAHPDASQALASLLSSADEATREKALCTWRQSNG